MHNSEIQTFMDTTSKTNEGGYSEHIPPVGD